MPAAHVTPQQSVTAFSKQAFKASVNEVVSAVVALPSDHDKAKVSIDRTGLPAAAADMLYCRAEISLDNGLTWCPKPNGQDFWPWGCFPIEFIVAGADVVDNGVALAESAAFFDLPAVGNTTRQVRIVIRPLRSATTQISVVSANGPIK